MKRILALVTALLMAVTVVSCGDKNKTDAVEHDAEHVYEMGVCNGNEFKSTWAGIKMTVPQDMHVLSKEDTYMMMGMTLEAIENIDDFEPEKQPVVYELCANGEDGSMVVINTFKSIDTASKIAEMKAEFDGKANDLLKPVYGEETPVTYGGVEFTRFDVTASAPDFVMYQTYLLKDVDEHVFCVSAAAFTEERVEELLCGISQYK